MDLFNFFQVLVPRTDIGVVSGKRKRVKREEMSALQQQAQLLDIPMEDAANSATVVKAFKVTLHSQVFCNLISFTKIPYFALMFKTKRHHVMITVFALLLPKKVP